MYEIIIFSIGASTLGAERIEKMKIMLTKHENDDFGVVLVDEEDCETKFVGLLEDAISEASRLAEEINAANSNAWRDFAERHGAGDDFDVLSKHLQSLDSAEDYFWAYDPADIPA